MHGDKNQWWVKISISVDIVFQKCTLFLINMFFEISECKMFSYVDESFTCIEGAIQLTLLLDSMALLGFLSFLVLGCENPKIAGATFPYQASINMNR